MPSRPGMAMSSSNRSGFSASVMRTALSPSLAEPTRSIPSQRASSNCSRSAASGSSSAIRTLSSVGSSIFAIQRQCQEDTITAIRHRAKFALSSRAEARRQPLTNISDANTNAIRRLPPLCRFVGRPAAVGDFDGEATRPRLACHDFQRDLIARRRDAVLDHILDQRLQDQARKPRILELGRNVDIDLQALWETDHLNVEIEALERNLLGQADVFRRVERQARAEEGRELQDHFLGFTGPA